MKENNIAILEQARIIWLALLHSSRTCLSNFRSLSVVILGGLPSLLSQIMSFPIFGDTYVYDPKLSDDI